MTLLAALDMVTDIIDAVQNFEGPVDIHFIGHSRGSVVISRALSSLLFLENFGLLPKQLKSGWMKLTMLDPHPAHNDHTVGDSEKEWFSSSPTSVGKLFEVGVKIFQEFAKDPEIIVPVNADEVEVYYQNTPWFKAPGVEFFFNVWGEAPVTAKDGVPGGYQQCNLTGSGVGHTEVHQIYLADVVGTLGSPPEDFVCPDGVIEFAETAESTPESLFATVDESLNAEEQSELNLLFPEFVDNRGVAQSLLSQIDSFLAAHDRGNVAASIGILNSLVHHVRAQQNKHIVPEFAEFLIGVAEFLIEHLEPATTTEVSRLQGNNAVDVEIPTFGENGTNSSTGDPRGNSSTVRTTIDNSNRHARLISENIGFSLGSVFIDPKEDEDESVDSEDETNNELHDLVFADFDFDLLSLDVDPLGSTLISRNLVRTH